MSHLTAVDDAWSAAVGRLRLVDRIETRLAHQGAVIELRQLHGLSAAEMDVLIHLELEGCPSSGPHAERDEVAA